MSVREALLEAVRLDTEKRAELVERGDLFDGYHPEMEAVHQKNAELLIALVDDRGWPTPTAVGRDGAEAAFIIAVHAIGLPDLQRRFLDSLTDAVSAGEAPPTHAAYLGDRIRFHEGRPQKYGTCLDWQDDGTLGPGPLENASNVDSARRAVGLPPLDESLATVRDRAASEGQKPPPDIARYRQRRAKWAEETGWR